MAEVTREHRAAAAKSTLEINCASGVVLAEQFEAELRTWVETGVEGQLVSSVYPEWARSVADAEARERQANVARIRAWANALPRVMNHFALELHALADDIERGDTASEGEVR